MGLEQIKVEYIDHMGSDLRVVDAARVSFDKASDGSEPEKDRKLIAYLAKHDHFTPFTHCMITVRETVPIFVARQRFKHTVGFTYNEVSRRYVDSLPDVYYPEEWRSRPNGSVKQGSGQGVVTELSEMFSYLHGVPAPNDSDYELEYIVKDTKDLEFLYHDAIGQALGLYYQMITDGVAPEMARMVLPQSMMTSYYVTGSLMAFARAYKLRADSHSQFEIQHLAKQWHEIISPLFPESWEALCN